MKVNLKLIGQFIEIFQMDESQIELEPDATVLDLLHAICKTDEQRKRIFVQTDSFFAVPADQELGKPGQPLRISQVRTRLNKLPDRDTMQAINEMFGIEDLAPSLCRS